jgi:predicted dehydrogenase
MSNHRAKNLWTMCGSAKHVGNVTAFLQVDVVDLPSFRIDLVFIETRNARHKEIVSQVSSGDSSFRA